MSPLAHEVVRGEHAAEDAPRLYLLHGFLGAGRNWSSFARRLVDLRTDWCAVLVDLRLHGESREVPGPHTVDAAGRDVVGLHEETGGGTAALLGHSFGGKVALAATSIVRPAPAQTWVIDSTPSAARRGSRVEGGAAGRMLARAAASPGTFADREEAVAWIEQDGFDRGTARWMATNLERRGDGLAWAFEPVKLRELLEDFAATDLWPVLESLPTGADVHFVRARDGSIMTESDAERLRELARRGEPIALHELEGGHWLHVDNPDGLLALVADRLPRPPLERGPGALSDAPSPRKT